MSNYFRDIKQIADLILGDPLNTGEKLVICSILYNEGEKFKVSIQIEEV